MTSIGPDGLFPGDQAGRRYLGLWLPSLPLDRIERRLPAAERGLARVTVAEEKGALRLVAVNRAAMALGLAPGLSLADARARHPGLAVAPAAPAADAALLGRLADAGARYTPLIAGDGPDGLLLDVTGCAHLFGGEAALVRDLIVRLRRAGFAARAALAATAGAAFAFARFGAAPAVVVPPDEALAPLLAPLPVAALRLDGTASEDLARLGLRRIGDLMDKPRAPLAARFGARVLRRLEEALGTAPSALAYRFPPPVFCAERRLMEPVERVEDVLGLAGALAAALAGPLERQDVGGRRLDLVLFRVDGRMTRLSVGARRPLRDPETIVRLFAGKVAALGVLDAGFGFDLIRLAVIETAPMAAQQAGFGADDAVELDGLIDRLAVRFGPMRVRRLVCADHHLPEAAGRSVSAQDWSPPAALPPGRSPLPDPLHPVAAASGWCSEGFVQEQAGTCDAKAEAERIAPVRAGIDRGSGVSLRERAVACDVQGGAGRVVPLRGGIGLSLSASVPRRVAAGGAQDGAERDAPRHTGIGCNAGISVREPAIACDAKEAGRVAPMRDNIGCGCGASVLEQTVACAAEQAAPMCGGSGLARVEDGPGPRSAGFSTLTRGAAAGSFAHAPPLSAGGLLDQVGAGATPGPSPGAVPATGQILRFPAAARPERPPAPGRPLSRLLAEDRSPTGRPVASASTCADPQGADLCGAARPLRLFAPPEPVEAVAEVPDGPPLRFRWRRRLHRVIRVEGPERISGAWWAGDARVRDYFRVETEEGCRFWLFRTDPPVSAPPDPAPIASPRPTVRTARNGQPASPEASGGAPVVGTGSPPLAFPRPGRVPPGAGRPGPWFLHGVLG